MTEEGKKYKVLVVDDDPTITKLVDKILTANSYETLLASDAPVGLEMAMKQSPDIIILDVMMPIINGFNICRLMKSEESHRHIPIILLTSRSTEDDRRIGDEVGADGYISKPFNTEELLLKIQELLRVGKS